MNVPGFVVIGGGAVGATYVRQLLRAMAKGALETGRITVVDRDRACEASRFEDGRVRLDVADWAAWLDDNLGRCGGGEHLVPYHWAPHLLLGWLEREVQRHGGATSRAGPLPSRGLPFEACTAAGDSALSYAAWTCPPLCIEPALCPHTRGTRDWSLAADLEQPRPGERFHGRIVWRCLHLVWGVGTIPVADIHAARDRVVSGLADQPRTYLVATSSHCHALATGLTAWRATPQLPRSASSSARRNEGGSMAG